MAAFFSPQFSALFLVVITLSAVPVPKVMKLSEDMETQSGIPAILCSSQSVNLTADREIVCPVDEIATYTCTVDSLQLQWIVEPFIPASGLNPVTFSNVPSSVGLTITRTGIVVRHVSNDPLLTTLTINSSVIDSSVDVSCSTIGVNPTEMATLPYFPLNGSPLEPVSGVNATPIVEGFTDGSTLVKFVPSPSPGITCYIINCTDSSCTQTVIDAMEDDAVVEASSSCGGSTHTVSVYAVNRCGRVSQPASTEVEIQTFSAFCVLVVLFAIVAAVAVILIVVVAVLIGYILCKKKPEGNQGAVKFDRREDGVDLKTEKP